MDQSHHLNNENIETDVDYSAFKVNSIGVFGVLAGLYFSFAVQSFYGQISVLNFVLLLSAAALILIALFLKVLFIKEFSRVVVFLFLESLAIASFFIFSSLSLLVAGIVALYFFSIFSCLAGRRELEYGLKINTRRVARSIIPLGVTALSLFIAASYLATSTHANAPLISKSLFLSIVLPSETFIHYKYPEFSWRDSFKNVAHSYVTAQIQSNKTFEMLPKEQQLLEIEAAVQNFKETIKKNYLGGTDFSEDDLLVDVLYKSFSEFTIRVTSEQKNMFMLVFGLILFLIIKSLGTILGIVVLLLSMFIYEILIVSGFAKVVLETRSKEIVIAK